MSKAPLLADDFDGSSQMLPGGGGGDHIIDPRTVFAFDIADDVHGLCLGEEDALASLSIDADFAAADWA